MNEPLVIRVKGNRYHIRLPNGQWHQYRSETEARDILFNADLNAYALLQEAFVEPEPIGEIEFKRLGRHRWWLDGKPQPVAVIRYLLRECGNNKEEIEAILHAHRISAEVEKTIERVRDTCKMVERETQCLFGKFSTGLRKRMNLESTKPSSQRVNSEVGPRRKTRRGITATKSCDSKPRTA